MKKCYKDTLANLISSELHKLTLNWYKAMEAEDEKAKEFWQSEIDKLKELDNIIWTELK